MTIKKNDDYIKRSWLLQEIEYDLGCYDIRRATSQTMFANLGDVVKMILAAPKEDVVKIIRCRNCVHKSASAAHDTGFYCERLDCACEPDGFCHHGKERI